MMARKTTSENAAALFPVARSTPGVIFCFRSTPAPKSPLFQTHIPQQAFAFFK